MSPSEKAQLGTARILKSGRPARHRRPNAREWPAVRAWLVERSLRSNPSLDADLTAYTPGEMLELLKSREIRAWHARMSTFVIPERFTKIVLVPCAKTKPWSTEASRRSALYRAYQRVVREGPPDVYFLTLSEPLGIVPQALWADFPQYDGPGLFRNDAQRAGATRAEWMKSPFGRTLTLPFDDDAYDEVIRRLGRIIGNFLVSNARPGRAFMSFVDDARAPGPHAGMLDEALRQHPTLTVERFAKRPAPRTNPCDCILAAVASSECNETRSQRRRSTVSQ